MHGHGGLVVAVGEPKTLLQCRSLTPDGRVSQRTSFRHDRDVGEKLLVLHVGTLVAELREPLVAFAKLKHRGEKERVGEEAAEVDGFEVDDWIVEATVQRSMRYFQIELQFFKRGKMKEEGSGSRKYF